MPAPHPRMHGLVHGHGGADPVLIAWEDIGAGGGGGGGPYACGSFDAPILDNFNRANEEPMSGGWAARSPSAFKVVSNQAALGTPVTSFVAAAYYSTAGTFTDCQAYVTLAVRNNWQSVMGRVQAAASGTAGGCYACAYNSSNDKIDLYTTIGTDGALSVSLGTSGILGLASGDKLGICCVGTTISCWIYKAAAWTSVLTVTNTSYTSGYLGLVQYGDVGDVTGRLDDFGGGAST